MNTKLFSLCLVAFVLFSFLEAACVTCFTYNATHNKPITLKTRSFTELTIDFPTAMTSGSFEYTDLSRSMNDFKNYQLPQALNGYKYFGIFKMDMQHVSNNNLDAIFTFDHDYEFSILNVNPKQLTIVGMDMDTNKVVNLQLNQIGTFKQRVSLQLEKKIYVLAIMGLEREISAKFGVPQLVSYRASLKYDLHPKLNQYLSVFVNRELTFPAHEYTTELVNNQIELPSSQLVELVSFSTNPMFNQDYDGNMVLNDFQLTFNTSLGFADKNGKPINIDFNSLKCLYLLDEKQGFVNDYSSVVFPGLQQLRCSPGVGLNNFFPKYVTIVAVLKNPVKPNSSVIPARSVIPQRSVYPANSIIPQRSVIPRRSILPDRSIIPYRSITPSRSVYPENSIIPYRSFAPYRSITPDRSFAPYRSVTPQRSVGPENSFRPYRSVTPQRSVNPANSISPDRSVNPRYSGPVNPTYSPIGSYNPRYSGPVNPNYSPRGSFPRNSGNPTGSNNPDDLINTEQKNVGSSMNGLLSVWLLLITIGLTFIVNL